MTDCDALNVAQGRVLSQIQNGIEKDIGYFSRCFSKAEELLCDSKGTFGSSQCN